MNPDDQPSDAPASLLAGRYRLGTRRGSAVDAALFEGVDTRTGATVVVKLVHPELTADERVKSAILATVSRVADVHHPNLAVVVDHGTAHWSGHEVVFTVSEHLTGGSLRDLIDRGRLLTPSQALVVGLDACKGLDALHRLGLVHGDVRPATVVFGADRGLRLVDAGLDYMVTEAAGGVGQRSNDMAKYVSPEQAQGRPAQPRSDVYSLCLTLFEAVTGTVPFVGDSTVATLANRVDRLLPVSADLGPLATVFERAGRPDPDDRATASEFGRALVQAAPKLPRPEPLPLLIGSLFADSEPALNPIAPSVNAQKATSASVNSQNEPDATTVMERDPDLDLEPAPSNDPAPLPPPVVPAAAAGVAAAATTLDDPPVAPSTAPPAPAPPVPAPPAPAAVTAPVAQTVAGVSDPGMYVAANNPELIDGLDEIDPADEFPERPPAVINRFWLVLLLAVLAIARGTLAWYNTQPDEVVVPEVTGLQAAAATNLLGDFEVEQMHEANETVPVGEVIRIEPIAGSRVDEGSSVTLWVSTGPAPRVLPELTGLTLEEATAKLEGMDLLVAEGEPVFDEAVPQGVVVSWTVPDSPALAAGGTVLRGTTVRLVVSAGPAPRTAPDLTNKTLAEATAAIEALDLVVAEGVAEYSFTVPAGSVIRQDPAPGAAVARDGTITLILSKGPEMVTLPSLAGLDFNGIKAALEGAGFAVGTIYGDPTQPLTKAVVKGQEVTAGYVAIKGTPVDLVFIPNAPPPA